MLFLFGYYKELYYICSTNKGIKEITNKKLNYETYQLH